MKIYITHLIAPSSSCNWMPSYLMFGIIGTIISLTALYISINIKFYFRCYCGHPLNSNIYGIISANNEENTPKMY